MEVKVTQADREAAAQYSDALCEKRPEVRTQMLFCLEEDFARHRISSQAELIEALGPFAKAADGRKDKGIYGAVCFQQHYLLKARAAIEKAKGEV